MKIILLTLSIAVIAHCANNLKSNRVKLQFRNFKMCLVNVTGVTSFGFHGSINKIIAPGENGDYQGEFRKGTPGELCLENDNISVKTGEVFNFYVYAIKDGKRIVSPVITRRRKVGQNPAYSLDRRFMDEDE